MGQGSLDVYADLDHEQGYLARDLEANQQRRTAEI